MNFYCENCGQSEIGMSSIVCDYSGCRTWRDGCCEAWKPKEKETNMVKVVRCKNCKYGDSIKNAKGEPMIECALLDKGWLKKPDWFCADGKHK